MAKHKFTDYYLKVNLDERGQYSASVYDPNDKSVFEIESAEQVHEMQTDGFLKYKPDEDLDRLTQHLMEIDIIPNGSQVWSEEKFEDKIREQYEEEALEKGGKAKEPMTVTVTSDIMNVEDAMKVAMRHSHLLKVGEEIVVRGSGIPKKFKKSGKELVFIGREEMAKGGKVGFFEKLFGSKKKKGNFSLSYTDHLGYDKKEYYETKEEAQGQYDKRAKHDKWVSLDEWTGEGEPKLYDHPDEWKHLSYSKGTAQFEKGGSMAKGGEVTTKPTGEKWNKFKAGFISSAMKNGALTKKEAEGLFEDFIHLMVKEFEKGEDGYDAWYAYGYKYAVEYRDMHSAIHNIIETKYPDKAKAEEVLSTIEAIEDAEGDKDREETYFHLSHIDNIDEAYEINFRHVKEINGKKYWGDDDEIMIINTGAVPDMYEKGGSMTGGGEAKDGVKIIESYWADKKEEKYSENEFKKYIEKNEIKNVWIGYKKIDYFKFSLDNGRMIMRYALRKNAELKYYVSFLNHSVALKFNNAVFLQDANYEDYENKILTKKTLDILNSKFSSGGSMSKEGVAKGSGINWLITG